MHDNSVRTEPLRISAAVNLVQWFLTIPVPRETAYQYHYCDPQMTNLMLNPVLKLYNKQTSTPHRRNVRALATKVHLVSL